MEEESNLQMLILNIKERQYSTYVTYDLRTNCFTFKIK